MRDRTGALRAIWFNQPFLNDVFRPHQRVILFGKLELTSHGLQLQNPQYEVLPQAPATMRRRRPQAAVPGDGRRHAAYRPHRADLREDRDRHDEDAARARASRARATARRAARSAAGRGARRARRSSTGEPRSTQAHFPPEHANLDELNAFRSPAQRRLIFEEFFLFQCGLVLRKRRASAEVKPRAVVITDEIRESARRVLPFKLTGDQKKVIAEIVGDMKRPHPMNRLLQGDVGSGKTIVALMAALVAMENGFQVAFMAPTEILAEQHYINIRRLLESSGSAWRC